MKTNHYIKCPVEMLKDKEMSNEAVRLYLTMTYLAWEQSTRGGKADELVMTHQTIHEYIGGNRNKAVKVVNELINKGYITKGRTRTKAGDYANKYVIMSVVEGKEVKPSKEQKSTVNVVAEPVVNETVNVADENIDNDDIKVNDMGNYIGKLEELDIAKNNVGVKGVEVASPVSIAAKEEMKVKETLKVEVRTIDEPMAAKSPVVSSAVTGKCDGARERAETQRQLFGDPDDKNIDKWMDFWAREDERLGRAGELSWKINLFRKSSHFDPFDRTSKYWTVIKKSGEGSDLDEKHREAGRKFNEFVEAYAY